jgi:flagellar basal body-associated protein FliL
MKTELEDFISENKEAFDNRMPDPAVLERIQQQMRALDKKKEKTIVVSMRVLLRVAACLIVVAGAATYWLMQKEQPAENTATVTRVKPVQTERVGETATVKMEDNKQVSIPAVLGNTNAIDEELASRKQVLFASLNNMESTSQRLTAATQASQLKNAGNDIVDALVKTMNTDPSTNVRLAALEGLSKFYKESYVKKQLIASLKTQKDPMVQIGLIELLTRMKQTIILDELDKIVKDDNTMKAVKDHAYSSMFTLRS